MKKLTVIIATLLSLSSFAQNTSIFCVQTNCPITIQAPLDSATIFGAGTILMGTDVIAGYQWKVVSTPTGATAPIIVSPNAQSTVVRKLVPGSYVFSLTVTTKGGGVQTLSNDQVTVLAAPAPPRTITGGTLKLVNGVLQFTPTYSDGKP